MKNCKHRNIWYIPYMNTVRWEDADAMWCEDCGALKVKAGDGIVHTHYPALGQIYECEISMEQTSGR